MDRRTFIGTVAGGLVAAPFTVCAQMPAARVYRIGVLSPFAPSDVAPWHRAFVQGLREFGWIEGNNISIEFRYAEGRTDALPGLVAEFVREKVDVLVTSVTPDTLAAKNATQKIPIVMASAGDPVASGLIASLARPGGNVTGLTQIAPELAAKRLELLKEMVPKLVRVGVIWNPDDLIAAQSWREIQAPAKTLGIELQSLVVRRESEFDSAFDAALKMKASGLAIMPSPLFVTNEQRIADFAVRNRLPSTFHLRGYAERGGLVTYGPDRSDLFRRAAGYVDKILRGAKPGDLPVERPTKFELVINLKTAKALGLTIPQLLLLRADEVIQ